MENTILGYAVLGRCLLTNEKSIEQAVEEVWQTANAPEETKRDFDFNNANLINVHVCLMIAYLASDKKAEGETTCLLKQHQEFYRAANKLQDLEEVSLKQKAVALLLLQLMIDDDKKATVFCGNTTKKTALIERVSFLNKTLTQYLNRSQGKPYVSLTILWSKFNPSLSSKVLSLSVQDKQKDPCTRAIEACEKLKQAQQARIVAIDEATEVLKREFERLKKEIEDHYANILAQELARIDAQTAEIKRKSKKQLEKGAMASLAAIGVTVATHGATKELAASLVVPKTVAHTMVTAGMSALIAKTTASMVMHNGNIGRVASELASTDTVKSTVTAMVSAGLLHQACQTLGIPLDFADRKEIGEHLHYNLAKTCINAGINIGVNHQDPDKALFLLAFNTLLDTIVDAHTKADVSDTMRIAMHTGAGYVSGLAAHVNPGQSALESFVGAAVSSTAVSGSRKNVFKGEPKETIHLVQASDKRKAVVQENNRNVVKSTPPPARRSGLVVSDFERELNAAHQKTQDLLFDAELERSFNHTTRGFRSMSAGSNTFPSNTSCFGTQPVLLWSAPNPFNRASEHTFGFRSTVAQDSQHSNSSRFNQYLNSFGQGAGRAAITVLNVLVREAQAAGLSDLNSLQNSAALTPSQQNMRNRFPRIAAFFDGVGERDEQVKVAVGRGMVNVYEGSKQFALEIGEQFNMVPSGSVARYTAEINAEREFYDNTPIGRSTIAKATEWTTEFGLTLALLGTSLRGFKFVTGAAGTGAIVSGLQATQDGQLSTRFEHAAYGAVGGAAGAAFGSYVISKVAGVASKALTVSSPNLGVIGTNKQFGQSAWQSFRNNPQEQIRITGGRSTYDRLVLREQLAEELYSNIRNVTNDVAQISKNLKILVFQVQRVKNHLFYNTHELDHGLGIGRFHPDFKIATAWQRLEAGTHTEADLLIFRHEHFESRFEGIFRTDYRTAHNAAERAGRPSGLRDVDNFEFKLGDKKWDY